MTQCYTETTLKFLRTNEHGSVPARPPVTDNDNKTAKPRWQQRLDRSLSGQSDNAYIGIIRLMLHTLGLKLLVYTRGPLLIICSIK